MARHTLSHAVDLYSGEAVKNGFLGSNRGLPIDLLILDDLGTPALFDANGYVVSESLSGAGNYSLDGALVTASVGVADVARGVQIVSSGADTAKLTFTGTDKFGTALTEEVTLNGNTIVFGKKAFKKITQIAADGANSNNVTIGTSDLIGLTYRVENPEDIVALYEDGAAGRTSRGAALASPAGVTAVAVTQTIANPISQVAVAMGVLTSVDLTDNSGGAASDTLEDSNDPVTARGGDGMDGTQESEVNARFVSLTNNIASLARTADRATVDLADAKVQVDRLVLESISYETQILAGVVDAAAYKAEIDKLVLDVAAQKVELDKLILDVDLGTVGSFVKADKTAATTTTGDVRGTYDPKVTLDGAKTIKVLLRPQARTSLGAYGVAQA